MRVQNLKLKIGNTLFRLNPKRYTLNALKGFTLIELLVTVSMFIIITSVVLVNFPSFSSKISLDNLAHEVALAVRQAQVFGVSSREFGVGSGIFPTHGVHFDKNQKRMILSNFLLKNIQNKFGFMVLFTISWWNLTSTQ